MDKAAKVMFVFWMLSLLFLAGCMRVGPNNVARDRFGYTDAISESWKRQMLLNLVKMRYADAPVFLDVASVVNQYLLEAELQGSLAWNAFLPTDSQNVTGRGRYANRPTITYQPLMGEKFTRSLMTPIRPTAIMSMIQAGWQADKVFRLGVQSVNGVYNRWESEPADPDFYRLTASMRRIQQSRGVGMRVHERPDKERSTVMFFRKEDVAPEVQAETLAVRKLLGLNPDQQEFKVVYGSIATNDQEIAILSRSMMEILLEIGSYIEVPETHVAEQRATPNIAEDADIAAGVEPLLRIRSSKEEPADAYTAIPYRDHWFWLDDRDFKSKRMFSFLMFLFSLAETGEPDQAPVLTIPAG